MRDDQVRRYARHIMLPDVGGLGQTAVMVSTVRLPLREAEPLAELVAGTFLAAGGDGTHVVANATEAQRADLAAHRTDPKVIPPPPQPTKAHGPHRPLLRRGSRSRTWGSSIRAASAGRCAT